MLQDISDADQADELVVLDDRKVANALLRHDPGNVRDWISRRARDDAGRHQVGNPQANQRAPLSRETLSHVAL
jgi:hypothetical protein